MYLFRFITMNYNYKYKYKYKCKANNICKKTLILKISKLLLIQNVKKRKCKN